MVTLTASPVFPVMNFVLDHKLAAFAIVGSMLGLNAYLVYGYLPSRNCAPGEACHVENRWSRWGRGLLLASVALYAVSLFFTYLTLPILQWID